MAGNWAYAQTIAYDVTQPGLIQNANGALVFTASGTSSSGTGTFGGFLTINSNNPQTSGISTSGTVGADVTGAQTSTQTFSQLPTTVINSVTYRSFGIDLNESQASGESFISLDSVVLYRATASSGAAAGPNANGSNLSTFTSTTAGLSVVWSLDSFTGLDPSATGAVTQDSVLLFDTAVLGRGSGVADIYLMIPDSAFAGSQSGDYFYLYAAFGGAGVVNGQNYENSGGFEEFGRVSGLTFTSLPSTIISPSVIPEASPSAALGIGLAAAGWWRARRRSQTASITA